ncbi:hypothetical protein GOBAR_AA38403 [Gossypium barbadense]|uniref:Uncharacterized protein n=1 Tax=Gossypium barbadense TaxID=3634 RepID=A0A2P5VTZ1_GOSBA|nr:hypothetical protein GOBAR_AA38403 [Gossypium barbadense]
MLHPMLETSDKVHSKMPQARQHTTCKREWIFQTQPVWPQIEHKPTGRPSLRGYSPLITWKSSLSTRRKWAYKCWKKGRKDNQTPSILGTTPSLNIIG